MNMRPRKLALAFASAAILTIGGCGGGGGTTTPASGNTSGNGNGGGGSDTLLVASSTTAVAVTVIDDAIGNATVCLDKNSNGACDTDEPSGKTDAAGKVTLQVAPADVGKFPILALIGADAVDAKYGPVTKAFTMSAPADQSGVVSPLTTLVQSMVASTGVTTAAAAASVQSQTGISVSLFEDYSKSSTPDSVTAAQIARMVVVTSQQQAAVLNGAVGRTAIDGTSIKTADLDKIIRNRLLEILPDLMNSLADPAVQAALKAATTPAQVTSALLAPANALIADAATGLTANSAATLAAINNQNQTPLAVVAPAAPVATASLRTLTFISPGYWFARIFTSTAAQNTPDSANTIRSVAQNSSSVPIAQGTAVANWNYGSAPNRQSDLHYTGTAWVNCAVNGEDVISVRDAAGNNVYNNCNQLETGRGNRATFDVSGKSMASVITSAIAAGYTNLKIGDNSPAALTSALGSTVFPVNSKMFYQASTVLTNAPAYYPGLGNYVQQSAANVAAGRTDPNVAAPCSASVIATPPDATSLEALATVNTGTPCINNAGTTTVTTSSGSVTVSSGARNENWGSTSLSLGVVGPAPIGGIQTSYYTTNTPIRVAFGSANSARYFTCQQRSTDGSTRNCNLVGTGSYGIATLGDARVMTFTGLPVNAASLTYDRVFVERGGKVYFGYQNKSGVFNSARLNLAGSNALLTQLGIPSVNPDIPLALTRESYAGTWDLISPATPTKISRISILANGGSACVNLINGVPAAFTCTVSVSDADRGVFTYSDSAGTGSGTLNFLSGAVVGTYTGIAGGVPASFSGARL
jgi:trimeric autotransporter adhesin